MNSIQKKVKNKPSIYIDTCIVRDVTERRAGREASIELLLSRIKSKGWSCKMSIFGLMELIDIEQESIFVNKNFFIEKRTLDEIIGSRRNRNLVESEFNKSYQYVIQFMSNYPFVEFVGLNDDGWSLAVIIASYSNLHATDVIHLVSAWQANCDVVVTDDEFFIKEAGRYLKEQGTWDKLRVCKPEKCYLVLKDIGYTNVE